ncbi:glutaminase [Nesterenkonia muleiensis]|uniref:glutaminase n=1 Tax=Nesterenkonia muleiensis TaxID=2282648 RepID=UPI000E709FE2|nr:glutaminase [Nesterenkonia muleiensis]
MRSPIPDYLQEVLQNCSADTSGHVADYIPELARADPDRRALAVATVDGSTYGSGDDEHQFTIQSISKPFIYALAIDDIGLQAVLEAVGVEPSGEAFNELSLEGGTGRPLNPMINAGAIAAHQLLNAESKDTEHKDSEHRGTADRRPTAPEHPARTDEVQRRTDRVLTGLSACAGRDLSIDYEAAESEYRDAYRNLAIAHMLRTHEVITNEPVEAVRGYIDQCAVLVTVRDIALMAATLANNGVQPCTGERVVSAKASRQALSVMTTCGMYDASGAWLARIGIPAKSGVSGGIIGVLPGQVGIASFSPRLDAAGNSVQGVEMFERLSQDMGLHLMSNEQPSNTAVRGIRTITEEGTSTSRIRLQGTIRFSGAERVLRSVVAASESGQLEDRIRLDLSRVESVSETGVRMLGELIRRLEEAGYGVAVDDPEGVCPHR